MTDYIKKADMLHEGLDQLTDEAPAAMAAFSQLMAETAGKEGTSLDIKTKELMALAIAVSLRCDGCISHHAKAVVEAGATRKEVLDTVGVCILMGGGPSVVYSIEALEAFDQFEKARQ